MKTTTDPKPHRVTLRLNEHDFTRLKRVAERHGLTLADAARLMIRRPTPEAEASKRDERD